LLSTESQLRQSISGPDADIKVRYADVAQISQQASQAQSNIYSSTESPIQHQDAVCEQYGFASSQCSQAMAAGVNQSVSSASGAVANQTQLSQRAATDIASIATDYQQIGSACTAAATSLATVLWPPSAQSAAVAVEEDLAAIATASQAVARNLATIGSGSPDPSAVNAFNAANNSYSVAITALHADLGLPPP
jgi:hypothetical protein